MAYTYSTENTYNHEAVELALYIDNDYPSYSMVQQALTTLGKHRGPGFDRDRALSYMEAVVGQCARRYCSEFASPSDRWWHIFDVPTRREVAEALLAEWLEGER